MPTESDMESRRLLHELQVYRIELEQQNAELREARAEAETSLERYTELYDFAPVGYFTLDPHGTIVQTNLAGAELLQHRRAEVVGTRFGSFLAEPSRSAFTSVLDRVCSGRQKESCELALPGAGRPDRFLQLTAAAEKSGEACRVVVFDITERRLAEIRLRESEEHLRLSQHYGGIGTWEFDPHTHREIWSDSVTQLLGFPEREQPTFEDYLAVIYPGDQQRVIEAMQAHIQHDANLDVEYRISSNSGETRWLRSTGQAERNAEGTVVRVRGIVQDITARKRVEGALRESEKRARRQLAELQAIYDSTPIGLCVLDRDLRYVRINQALAKINGLPAADHIGKTVHQIIPSLAPMVMEIAERILRTGEGVTDVELSGATLAEPEVQRTWIEQWLPLKDAGGEIVGINVVADDITERKAADEEIRRLAFYDSLTQLPNRRFLMDRLRRALAVSTRTRLHGVLLFIDLDNFKWLNDTLGHDQGDLLLQQVARRLVACVRESDTVARFGGDEFVVMLEHLSSAHQPPEAQARIVAEKILGALAKPYSLAGQDYTVTPSVGITLFLDHRDTVDQLLKQADLAMYQAKAAGRNIFRFFDPAMQAALEARASLEAELRVALREDQFQLHYQPQVDESGRMTGVEALLRWQHPRRGLLAPDAFMALAEETGLIRPLGLWSLETACRQLAAWQDQPATSQLTLAVNVSVRQFRDPEFVARVSAVLDQTGADPHKLKLELTESLLLDDAADAITKMTALKARGVGFCLDDLGTGYSSLSRLKQLPLDELKIDRTFVRDVCTSPNGAALARMVLSLGETLGLAVVAEGVETEAQGDFLAEQGCRVFQGYLFGRPGPTEALRLGAGPATV